MNSPQISIIVPVYNVEPYLPKCIESILQQTFADWELLLIDDGSVDKSGAICDEYAQKDSRISVYHIANGGVSNARNWGLKKAVGPWVTFVDSDDWISHDFIGSLHAFVQQYPDLDFVQGGCRRYSLDGESSAYQQYVFYLSENKLYLLNNFRGLAVSKLYKTAILKANHIGYDTNLRVAEDYTFTMDYIRHVNKYCFVPETGYYYRMREKSATKKPFSYHFEKDIPGFLHQYESILTYIKVNGIKKEDAKIRYNHSSNNLFDVLKALLFSGIRNWHQYKSMFANLEDKDLLIKYQDRNIRKIALFVIFKILVHL